MPILKMTDLDLRGKRVGLPLHVLAGGAKSRVPMYSTEGGWLHIDPSALVDDALAMREAGFLGSKIKIGKPTVAGDEAREVGLLGEVGDIVERGWRRRCHARSP